MSETPETPTVDLGSTLFFEPQDDITLAELTAVIKAIGLGLQESIIPEEVKRHFIKME